MKRIDLKKIGGGITYPYEVIHIMPLPEEVQVLSDRFIGRVPFPDIFDYGHFRLDHVDEMLSLDRLMSVSVKLIRDRYMLVFHRIL